MTRPSGFVITKLGGGIAFAAFYFGILLLVPLVAFPRVFLDRKVRGIVVVWGITMAGLGVEVFFSPHYAAPLTCLNVALAIQALRHLRVWRRQGRPVGLFLARVTPVVALATLALLLTGLRLDWPPAKGQVWWSRATLNQDGRERERVENQLAGLAGQHLAVVRYGEQDRLPPVEWVYNAADIDGAKVVWAREMGPEKDRELLRYYTGRRVWLVEPDKTPVCLVPYPVKGTP